MEMLYHIVGLCPQKKMSGGGFCIHLWPGMKEAVSRVNLRQTQINAAIERCHRQWLDGCNFDAIFDPGEDLLDKWKREKAGGTRKLSKDARPLYDAHSIQVAWGEWGVEHVTVPGDACGLDIDSGYGAPRGGRILGPHNVDHIDQAHLLLVVFLFFADTIVLQERVRLHE